MFPVRARLRRLAIFCAFVLLAASAVAKDKSAVGIVLYDTPSGPAFVQAVDILINGKNEVVVCADQPTVNNDAYKRFAKVKLDQAQAIERDSAGVLRMTTAGGKSCIVPANLKLEKKRNYSLKELADQAVFSGRVLSKSANGGDVIPKFEPGGRLQFVATADPELAEYLRVSRAPNIALYSEYLKQYPAAAHTGEVKASLAALYIGEGEAALNSFKKSADFALLKTSKDRVAAARKVQSANPRADRLGQDVEALLQATLNSGRSALGTFQEAINERKPGYAQLVKARTEVSNIKTADAAFPNAAKLAAEIETQQQLLDQSITDAEAQLQSGDTDAAYTTIYRYAAFDSELPRIAAIVEAAARLHHENGQKLAAESKWESAIAEFKRSIEIRKTNEAEAALKGAEASLQAANDRIAADQALASIEPMIASKQFIEAYETLSRLSPGQRQHVSAKLEELRADYITDLTTRAGNISRLHVPIRGRADEDAVRQAYAYLARASELNGSEEIALRLELISEKISEYYLMQANKQLDKPRGSGIGLGWHLLLEGQRYRRDFEPVRNQITKFSPAYDTRGKLSIAVQFRDQTSRRDSLGFADQMADTIASRLEAAGFRNVRILTRDRIPSPNDPLAAQPNFALVGDIMQHRVEKKIETQRLNSKYRAGHREVRNPAWLEQRRAIETLERDYQLALENARVVAARNKKKEMEAAQKQIDEITRQIEAEKRKLEGVPEMLLQDIVQPYNYTKRVFALNAVVEVNFRAADGEASAAGQSDSVKVELPKTAHVLENVKPEDTEGVVEEGTPPDEIQLLADAEAQAQDAMVKKITAWIDSVPGRVLADARDRVTRQDREAAAERYVLYLNITPEKETTEREEALKFLRNEFNISALKVE